MARSHAVSAREPGQIREEAALSGTAHAPWGSLTGADDRRERPGPFFDGGCTVHMTASAGGAPPPGRGRARRDSPST